MPQVRAFIFDRQPDLERLVAAAPDVPVRTMHGPFAMDQLIDRIFLQALSRQATATERAVAEKALGDASPVQALADLLWSVAMLPEFQMIR